MTMLKTLGISRSSWYLKTKNGTRGRRLVPINIQIREAVVGNGPRISTSSS